MKKTVCIVLLFILLVIPAANAFAVTAKCPACNAAKTVTTLCSATFYSTMRYEHTSDKDKQCIATDALYHSTLKCSSGHKWNLSYHGQSRKHQDANCGKGTERLCYKPTA